MSKHSKKPNKHLPKTQLFPDNGGKSSNVGGSSRVKPSVSENILKKHKPLKPSISTKSWSVNQKYGTPKNDDPNDSELTHLKDLNATNDSEDFDCSSNLLRARDSLENLLKTERFLENTEMKLEPPTSTSSSPDTSSPRSLPALNEPTKSTIKSKSSAWESNEKSTKSRKSKDKKKKWSKTTDILSLKSPNQCDKSGDEKTTSIPSMTNSMSENLPFLPYEPKPSRSVVFTNEVMVVYFNGERVVCESKEPLKKELDQQVRNKEMRRGHLLSNI